MWRCGCCARVSIRTSARSRGSGGGTWPALSGLFVQSLRLCRQARLVGLGSLALDGTKLRANASRHKAMSHARMVKKEQQLEAEIAVLRGNVDRLLREAERVDAEEDKRFGRDRRGDELPAELQRREQRLAAIREAKQALEAEASAHETRRRAELEAQGKKPRPPRDGRDPYAPKPTAQRNFTDPESRIMKTSDGSFHQCFNGQALVDSQAQVIVAAEVSDQAPDAEQLEPALEQLDENLDAIGTELREGAVLTADGGYFSEQNVKTTIAHGLDPYIATGRFKHSEPPPPAPRGPIPRNATPKQLMARKTRTVKGRAVYARRKAIVEPVFGQMDTVQNARRLLLRGKQTAREQWRFHCAIHNLLKLHRNGGLARIQPHNIAQRRPPRLTGTGASTPRSFRRAAPTRSDARSDITSARQHRSARPCSLRTRAPRCGRASSRRSPRAPGSPRSRSSSSPAR